MFRILDLRNLILNNSGKNISNFNDVNNIEDDKKINNVNIDSTLNSNYINGVDINNKKLDLENKIKIDPNNKIINGIDRNRYK